MSAACFDALLGRPEVYLVNLAAELVRILGGAGALNLKLQFQSLGGNFGTESRITALENTCEDRDQHLTGVHCS